FPRFVHGSCDPEADLASYQRKKEANPDYDYICPHCKNLTQAGRQLVLKRKDSTEDCGMDSSFSASQESLYMGDDSNDTESVTPD
ncbi:unnamed protein product, partial [Timema podura]|nr:unnamed protein product [Timema podura]